VVLLYGLIGIALGTRQFTDGPLISDPRGAQHSSVAAARDRYFLKSHLQHELLHIDAEESRLRRGRYCIRFQMHHSISVDLGQLTPDDLMTPGL
jgi:hypothetical protein